MKRVTQAFALVLALIVGALTASAQTSDPVADIPQGKMAIQFDSALLSSLTTNGIALAYKGYSTNPKKGIGFSVPSGTMDLATGVGEVASTGSLTLTQGAGQITLKNFLLDTSAASPFLSAIVLVNGRSAGRQPVFQLVSSNPFATPLQYGEYVTGTTYFQVSPAFKSEMNDYFTGTAFGTNIIVGSINCDVFLTVPQQ